MLENFGKAETETARSANLLSISALTVIPSRCVGKSLYSLGQLTAHIFSVLFTFVGTSYFIKKFVIWSASPPIYTSFSRMKCAVGAAETPIHSVLVYQSAASSTAGQIIELRV